MGIYDYVWSDTGWISADAVAKPPRGAEIAAHLTPSPPILSNAVAKPPRGDEIAAHVPPDPPVLSNAVAYPPHGAGADGKYATNFAVSDELRAIFEAFFDKIGALFDEHLAQLKADFANCAQNDAERAQLDAERAKLVAKRAGSSATTFTGQLAVAGHSGISPEGGGGCCVWLW